MISALIEQRRWRIRGNFENDIAACRAVVGDTIGVLCVTAGAERGLDPERMNGCAAQYENVRDILGERQVRIRLAADEVVATASPGNADVVRLTIDR